LEQGLPLLRDEMVPLDTRDFARRCHHVCAAVARHQDNSLAPAVAEALRRDELDPRQLTDATLAGHPEKIHARADELGLDAGLTTTVLRLTLFPVLSRISGDLSSLLAGLQWERGYCPICGSWPLLGEFRGLEQTRFLRCGLCAADWEFPRLRCPFCDTSDHRRLDYFYAEAEEGKYRVATCAECRGYVKMLSSLTALSPPALLVADIATMHLDLIAASRGYQTGD
jgi:FdhE protein